MSGQIKRLIVAFAQKSKRLLVEASTWLIVIAFTAFAFALVAGLARLFHQAESDEHLSAFISMVLTVGGVAIAFNQLLLMRKQNDVLLQRAHLNIYDEEDRTTPANNAFPLTRPQCFSHMSRRFHVSNTGNRGAHGFTLTVHCKEKLALANDSAWDARSQGGDTLFIYNSEKPVFPNALVPVPVLLVYSLNSQTGAMLNDTLAQVAYDDGISTWVKPVRVTEFVPKRREDG